MNVIPLTLFFYAMSGSALFFYGFGLERSYFESHNGPKFFSRIPLFICVLCISIAILWPVTVIALIPLNLPFLIPVVTILVYSLIQQLCLLIFKQTAEGPTGERLFLLGILFLSLHEALSFIDALCMILSSVASLIIVTTILFSVRERLALYSIQSEWKGLPAILVSLGLCALALYGLDVSWWL